MSFDERLARSVVTSISSDRESEKGLDISFVEVRRFLSDNPDRLSWRSKNKPSVENKQGLEILAAKFFSKFRRSDFPARPSTIPDEMVSIVMQYAYDYSPAECERIKIEH